jgi:hypothetical protein
MAARYCCGCYRHLAADRTPPLARVRDAAPCLQKRVLACIRWRMIRATSPKPRACGSAGRHEGSRPHGHTTRCSLASTASSTCTTDRPTDSCPQSGPGSSHMGARQRRSRGPRSRFGLPSAASPGSCRTGQRADACLSRVTDACTLSMECSRRLERRRAERLGPECRLARSSSSAGRLRRRRLSGDTGGTGRAWRRRPIPAPASRMRCVAARRCG